MVDENSELLQLIRATLNLPDCSTLVRAIVYEDEVVVDFEDVDINASIIEALAELFGVSYHQIHISPLEKVVDGCATCGHGSRSEGSIKVCNVRPERTKNYSSYAKELANKYLKQRQEEEREEREYAAKQKAEKLALIIRAQKDNELKKLKEETLLNVFDLNANRIFNEAIKRLERYRNVDRKTMAISISQDDPYRNILFKFHDIIRRGDNQLNLKVVFGNITKNKYTRIALAEDFVEFDGAIED